jgi:uncharacterized membrane protein YhaH (DUF805 family)
MNTLNSIAKSAKSIFAFRGKTNLQDFGTWIFFVFLLVLAVASFTTGASQEVALTINILLLALLLPAAAVRRRRDAGMHWWSLLFWIAPASTQLIGAATGSLTPKPIPSVDPSLGDMGILVFLSPQVVGAASVMASNALNQLFFVVIPTGMIVILAVYELVLNLMKPRKPASML